jgi:hypothetical protein
MIRGGAMYITVVISNPRKPWLNFSRLKCLVDGSSLMFSISQKIADLLQLEELEKRWIITDDGKKILVPYVGPLKIDFEERSCYACAFVIGDQPMLGAIRMSEADFIVHKSHHPIYINFFQRYSIH